MQTERPEFALPAPSTVGELLKKHGLVRSRKRRLRLPFPFQPLDPCQHPNAVWCADFKGHFPLGDGRRCYPLTVTNGFSRYLLVAVSLVGAGRHHARAHRARPPRAERAARADAPHAQGCASPRRRRPTRPRAFDRFRFVYNDKRPHEALGQRPPNAFYRASARPYPAGLREPDYDDVFAVRKLNHLGHLKRPGGHKVYVAKCLAHQPVGLRPVGDGQFQLYYGPLYLGLLDDRGPMPRVLRKP